MKLVSLILIAVILLFNPPFAQSGCSVDEIHFYHYSIRYQEHVEGYKYHLKCILTSLPMGVPLTTYVSANYADQATAAVSIDFTGSTINTIPVGVFHEYHSVEDLKMNGSSIVTVSPGAFGGMIKLTTIQLENNNISEISEGTFNGLVKLESLDLSNNNLVNLSSTLFFTTIALHTISLKNNSIINIPEGLFNKTKLITKIDLSYNKIQSIPYNELFGRVELKSNCLTTLSPFGDKITGLNISYNNITSLPAMVFNQSVLMVHLRLNNNNISNVDHDAFAGLKNLDILDLSYNKISVIFTGTFSELTNLTYLDISFNNLEHLDFGFAGGLTRLMTLKLNNNKIATLEAKVLFPMKSLSSLHLDGNLLTTIDALTISSHLKTLKNISLDRNQLKCDRLTNYIYALNIRDIHVQPGNSLKTNNVDGIYCISNIQKDVTITQTIASNTSKTLPTTEEQTTAPTRQEITIEQTIPPMKPEQRESSTKTDEFPLSLVYTHAPSTTDIIITETLTSKKSEDTRNCDESQYVARVEKMATALRREDDNYDEILKSTHSLLIFVTVVLIVLILINLTISLLNMYARKRDQLEYTRKSTSSCAVELLNITD